MAAATLSFQYAQQIVWIDDLHADDSPANHDLCAPHADRTRPPRGWTLEDRRSQSVSLALSSEDTRTAAAVDPLRRAG